MPRAGDGGHIGALAYCRFWLPVGLPGSLSLRRRRRLKLSCSPNC